MMMIWMLCFFVVMLVYVGVVSADDVGVVSDSKVLFRKRRFGKVEGLLNISGPVTIGGSCVHVFFGAFQPLLTVVF